MTDYTIETLSAVYARFFARDFTHQVFSNLKKTCPLTPGLESYIDQTLDQLVDKPLVLNNNDTINLFIHECADYALEQNLAEIDDYDTWTQVSALPSAHHGEIATLAYASADHYTNMFHRQYVGLIAKDASIAAQTIATAAQTRTQQTETGGNVHLFNWGILNDGLWVNGALMKAYQLASIFRPGDKVLASYAETAFTFAKQHAAFKLVDKNELASLHGEVDSLIAQLDPVLSADYLSDVSQETLNTLLFTDGAMLRQVSMWDHGQKNPLVMVESVKTLSTLARLGQSLSETAKLMPEDTISETLINRLHAMNDVVTLALAGYAALRETKFAETLILGVTSMNDDPCVDVVVNDDLRQMYVNAGGEESDLIRFGLHLDPRGGVPASMTGWSMSYALNRRDDVNVKIMSQEADRLEKLRRGDARVIEAETQRIVSDVTRSYLEAANKPAMSSKLNQRITKLADQVTRPGAEISLDREVASILVDAIGNESLSLMNDTFMNLANSEQSLNRQEIGSYTIAHVAVRDVIDMITVSHAE